jgi:hypothetical protein
MCVTHLIGGYGMYKRNRTGLGYLCRHIISAVTMMSGVVVGIGSLHAEPLFDWMTGPVVKLTGQADAAGAQRSTSQVPDSERYATSPGYVSVIAEDATSQVIEVARGYLQHRSAVVIECRTSGAQCVAAVSRTAKAIGFGAPKNAEAVAVYPHPEQGYFVTAFSADPGRLAGTSGYASLRTLNGQ